MEEKHKKEEGSIIPESPAQSFIRKAERRDKAARTAELFVLAALVFFNIFIGIRLQQVIDNNQQNTLIARQQSVDRQSELKDYIKCILLIRYDSTPEQLSTRKGVEAALDKCAAKQP